MFSSYQSDIHIVCSKALTIMRWMLNLTILRALLKSLNTLIIIQGKFVWNTQRIHIIIMLNTKWFFLCMIFNLKAIFKFFFQDWNTYILIHTYIHIHIHTHYMYWYISIYNIRVYIYIYNSIYISIYNV